MDNWKKELAIKNQLEKRKMRMLEVKFWSNINEVKEEIEAILRLSRRGKPELVEKRKEELKSMVSEEQYINIISKINSQLAEDKY